MAIKYCTKCGAEMQEDAKFCTKCGQSFDNNIQTNDEQHTRINKKSLYALLAVLSFLFLIIIAAIFYSEYSERREARIAREKFVADSLKQARIDSIKLAEQKEKERLDSIERARILSLREPYLKLLDKYGSKDDLMGEYYFLYDLNGDNFPELWMQVFENGECRLLVYTNVNGNAKLLLRTDVGHPYHHSFHKGNNYILIDYAHMGCQYIDKIYLKKGEIKVQNILSFNMADDDSTEYKEVSEPGVNTYELTDTSPIYEIE